MKFDLHVHSKYSYDSLLSPERIIKCAKKKNLDGIAVTDHNTIQGGLETSKINNDKDFQVIIGSEIKTEFGDIIGLFLQEEIKTRIFFEVLDSIREQGGVSILAHPFRQYKEPEKICGLVDLLEGFNARSKRDDNIRAYNLGINCKKTLSAGSDAHFFFEIGRGQTHIHGEDIFSSLKNGTTIITGNEMSYYLAHGFSLLTENFKRFYS